MGFVHAAERHDVALAHKHLFNYKYLQDDLGITFKDQYETGGAQRSSLSFIYLYDWTHR